MKIISHPHLNLAQRFVLAGLLLCMVLAQSLSFAHRTLHHDMRMLAHAHENGRTALQVGHGHDQTVEHGHGTDCDHGIFSRLFASHEDGDETCRLIDGASAFLDINGHTAGVLSARYAPVLVAFDAAAMAAWRAPLFEARGPPVHFH